MKTILLVNVCFVLITAICCSDAKNKKNTNKLSEIELKYSNLITSTIKSDDLLSIDIDKLENKIYRLSELFSSIKYIPLETKKESLIGRIRHIELINDTIYILDASSSKCLFIFSLDGKFIRRIGEVGRGPGEFISPSDFTIDVKNHEIYIIDSYIQKINIYSTSGKFKRMIKYKADVRSNYIEYKNGQLYLDARMPKNAGFRYLLRRIDNSGNELNRWFNVPEYNKGWNMTYYIGGSGTLYSAPQDIKYTELFMDTIFSITSLGIKPFIAIQTENYLTPKHLTEILKDNPGRSFDIGIYMMKENLVWCIHNYIENDDVILFQYNIKNTRKYIYISKKSMKPLLFGGIIDDLTFKDNSKPDVMPILFSGSEKIVIGQIYNTEVFQSKIRSYNSNLLDSEKNAILNAQLITSNPILCKR